MQDVDYQRLVDEEVAGLVARDPTGSGYHISHTQIGSNHYDTHPLTMHGITRIEALQASHVGYLAHSGATAGEA